jgi:hypothetical protein
MFPVLREIPFRAGLPRPYGRGYGIGNGKYFAARRDIPDKLGLSFDRRSGYPVRMSRCLFFLVLALALVSTRVASAQDDGPPIAITSPDTGTTFAYGTVKSHALVWNKKEKVLIAQVIFADENSDSGPSNDDTHEFRLPGVTFDEAKGVFFATTAKGEVIPVARIKKTLFIKTIEVLPNANIRILHPRGLITVILEAISPNDPAMHPPPDNSNPDATHSLDIDKILN